MVNKFSTSTYSIETLQNSRYIIPPYQRPYVWGEEQINRLLSDFYDAYLRGDKYYYIGTILTSQKENIHELIDGQQRFTTLWLIAVSLKILGVDSEIKHFLKVNDDLRIDFAIRKQLKSYFISLLDKSKNEKNVYTDNEIESDEYLTNIAKAVTTISRKLATFTFNGEFSLAGYGNYICKNIQFIVNTAPENTNLNKLFSTINNSGLQLEQTDILKSLLLKNITNEKFIYSRIWEACENMNNYFERNISTLFSEIDWAKIKFEDLKEFNSQKFNINDNEDNSSKSDDKEYSISDILDGNITAGIDENGVKISYNSGNEDSKEIVYFDSIISFSQLLLHAYRIYRFEKNLDDFEQPFHSKNLLAIFELLHKNDDAEKEKKIKDFLRCLWKVRYVFDKDVVKWIRKPEEKNKKLRLTSIHKNTQNFSRTDKGKDEIVMLQSVLYFTGNYNTQIWLTPYLKRLLDNDEKSLEWLEDIDNKLSLSLKNNKQTTYELMNKDFKDSEKINFVEYLNGNHGVSFKHYWFQKVEYLLWKKWKNKSWGTKENKEKFDRFRITSKNSVEHIYPQNSKHLPKLGDDALHSFGNLVLLSVSQNSEYSCKPVDIKRIEFNKKSTFDTLKSYKIFNCYNDEWDKDKIKQHKQDIILLISSHYQGD